MPEMSRPPSSSKSESTSESDSISENSTLEARELGSSMLRFLVTMMRIRGGGKYHNMKIMQ
jgi:hypothetical protein